MFFKVSILSVHTIILTLVLFLVNPENHKIAKFSVDIPLKLWQYWKKPKRLHILQRSQKCEICNILKTTKIAALTSLAQAWGLVQILVHPPLSPQYWWFKIGRSIDDPTLMLIIQILESFKTGFNVSLGICVYINYGLYRNIYPNIYYIYILDFGEFKQDSEFLDICVSINWFPF